jgi:hypothetical protein
MPVTKITLSTAMRARDVSRPRDQDLTEAAEREEAAARPAGRPSPGPRGPAAGRPAPGSTTPGSTAAAEPGPRPGPPAVSLPPVPAPPRRRRRRGR